METVRASFMLHREDITLFVEPTPGSWVADSLGDGWQAFVLLALDEAEKETGEVAGVRIMDFLDFDQWEELPKLPLLWQIPGWEPLPLEEVLKREQQLLKEEAAKPAPERARAG
jgi:hypothetical protein